LRAVNHALEPCATSRSAATSSCCCCAAAAAAATPLPAAAAAAADPNLFGALQLGLTLTHCSRSSDCPQCRFMRAHRVLRALASRGSADSACPAAPDPALRWLGAQHCRNASRSLAPDRPTQTQSLGSFAVAPQAAQSGGPLLASFCATRWRWATRWAASLSGVPAALPGWSR